MNSELKTAEEVFNDYVNIRTVGNEVAQNIIDAMVCYAAQFKDLTPSPSGGIRTETPFYEILNEKLRPLGKSVTKIKGTAVGDRENMSGYLVVYEDGYKSWSPKETFERAYRLITDAERGLI